DTHYSIMRGAKSGLVIKQGEEENYKPTLYIKSKGGENFDNVINEAIGQHIHSIFPGTKAEKVSEDTWKINIPDEFKIGHEAHFAQVTQNYLRYLEEGKLPNWEVPNMITKYYTTIEGYKMAKK